MTVLNQTEISTGSAGNDNFSLQKFKEKAYLILLLFMKAIPKRR